MDILALMRERAADEACPRCRGTLRDCTLSMLREEDPQYTLQITCARCGVRFVVVVQVRERAEDEAAATPQGTTPRAMVPAIAPEELLTLHEVLRDHRGPLTDLLAPPQADGRG